MAAPPPKLPAGHPRTFRWRMGVFLLAALSVLALLHIYVGARLIGPLPVSPVVSGVAWAVLAALYFGIPGGFFLFRARIGSWGQALRAFSVFWLGAFGVLLSTVVLTDVVRLVLIWALGVPRVNASPWVQPVVVLALTAAGLTYGLTAARTPRVKRVRVPLAGLGKAFEGFRIVQLTDLHIRDSRDAAFLARTVEQVNALAPDMVVITGDLVDGAPEAAGPALSPLGELRAEAGIFYVTGNHEYYHGGATVWESAVERLGMTALHNAHRVVRRGDDVLVIAGVPDLQATTFEPESACRPDLAFHGAPKGVRVLLAHQPRAGAMAMGLDIDLQLSGHTHGGQIVPFMFFVRLQQPMVSGLRRLYGRWVYTSRGTGYWGPPLRVGAPPEISELILVGPAVPNRTTNEVG